MMTESERHFSSQGKSELPPDPRGVSAMDMRCYYVRDGRIVAFDEIDCTSEDDAIAKAHKLFAARKEEYDGFELRDRTRVVCMYSVRRNQIRASAS
jgi:hypothetical protein